MASQERILVLGGDGFCGWPTSLRLSTEGYEVVIVDNLSRRKIDVELGCQSLTPIQPIDRRLQTWQQLTGKQIDYRSLNIAEEDVYKRQVMPSIGTERSPPTRT